MAMMITTLVRLDTTIARVDCSKKLKQCPQYNVAGGSGGNSLGQHFF